MTFPLPASNDVVIPPIDIFHILTLTLFAFNLQSMASDARGMDELEEEVEIEESDEGDIAEEGDYEEYEEQEEEDEKDSQKYPKAPDGRSLVDFFESALSASAASLNLPKRASLSAKSSPKPSKNYSNHFSSPSEAKKPSMIGHHQKSRSSSTQSRPNLKNRNLEDEEDEEEENRSDSDVEEAKERTNKKRNRNSTKTLPNGYWPQQHTMQSYPYNSNQWYTDAMAHPWQSYFSPPPHAYPQASPYHYQQHHTSANQSESAQFYYGLAMGLYQAANLIYQNRVSGFVQQPQASYAHSSDYNDYYLQNEEYEEEEAERPKKKKKLSKSPSLQTNLSGLSSKKSRRRSNGKNKFDAEESEE